MLKNKTSWLMGVFFFLITNNATSAGAPPSVCFTPNQNCTEVVAKAIADATKSILLQARDLTSTSIARELITAKNRGVNVRVILDKTQWAKSRYSASRMLLQEGIPVWIDFKPFIANNNVLILDSKSVITGSLTFTEEANHQYAENIVNITDKEVVKQFIENWYQRQKISKPIIFQVTGLIRNPLPKSQLSSKTFGADPLVLYKVYFQMLY